jgi:hypothetical protein
MAATIPNHIQNVFNSIGPVNDEYLRNRGRMASTIPPGLPLITIEPKDDDTYALKFIRSAPGYEFKNLLKGLNNYTRSHGRSKITLENDALFSSKTNSDCRYNALYYRIFKDNKDSIYVAQGFLPQINISEDKRIVYNFTVGDAKKLVENINTEKNYTKRFKPLKDAIQTIPDDNNKARFGEWLTNLDCKTMASFFILLQALASDFSTKKIDVSTIPDSSSQTFLQALRRYQKAHNTLVRTVPNRNGGSRHRSLRPKSHITRRKRFISRKTRKSRKYH